MSFPSSASVPAPAPAPAPAASAPPSFYQQQQPYQQQFAGNNNGLPPQYLPQQQQQQQQQQQPLLSSNNPAVPYAAPAFFMPQSQQPPASLLPSSLLTTTAPSAPLAGAFAPSSFAAPPAPTQFVHQPQQQPQQQQQQQLYQQQQQQQQPPTGALAAPSFAAQSANAGFDASSPPLNPSTSSIPQQQQQPPRQISQPNLAMPPSIFNPPYSSAAAPGSAPAPAPSHPQFLHQHSAPPSASSASASAPSASLPTPSSSAAPPPTPQASFLPSSASSTPGSAPLATGQSWNQLPFSRSSIPSFPGSGAGLLPGGGPQPPSMPVAGVRNPAAVSPAPADVFNSSMSHVSNGVSPVPTPTPTPAPAPAPAPAPSGNWQDQQQQQQQQQPALSRLDDVEGWNPSDAGNNGGQPLSAGGSFNALPGGSVPGPVAGLPLNAAASNASKRRHYPTAQLAAQPSSGGLLPNSGPGSGSNSPLVTAGPVAGFPASYGSAAPSGGSQFFTPGQQAPNAATASFLPPSSTFPPQPDATGLSGQLGGMSLGNPAASLPPLPIAGVAGAAPGFLGPNGLGPNAGPFAVGNQQPAFLNGQPQAGMYQQQGYGSNTVNLLSTRATIPETRPTPTNPPHLTEKASMNCSPDVMRLTLNAIPKTANMLAKSRLPLGLHVLPYADPKPSGTDGIAGIPPVPVINSSLIVRCRSCRTYLNPFVQFLDQGKKFRCNLCFRINDIPPEFDYYQAADGSTGYIDRNSRPELTSGSIEYVAPTEYMVRPPQPAAYLFLIDVSYPAVESGLVAAASRIILNHLDELPGDSRTRVGFITYDSTLHFYNFDSGLSQPQMLVVSDLEEVFLPSPDGLLVTLAHAKELVKSFLVKLPSMFQNSRNTDSVLAAALMAAFQLMSPTGGRISVLQTSLPTAGPHALTNREDASIRGTPKEIACQNTADEFYKKFAVDCSRQQIGVDVFMFSNSYIDVATLSCLARHSGGSVYSYPGFHSAKHPEMTVKFNSEFTRNLTRNIGFEAVMRVRCTQGLTVHSFHGSFFLRQTDLLALPNVSPDHSFAMQVSIDEPLTSVQTVCFQTALLYTASNGERRIRVHTLAAPVAQQISELFDRADPEAIAGLAAKMAINRMLTTKLSDARDGLMNICNDVVAAFKAEAGAGGNAASNSLLLSNSLRLLPLYMLSLLKNPALRLGKTTSLDERSFACSLIRVLPLHDLMRYIYPSMYSLHDLPQQCGVPTEQGDILLPALLPLSSERLDRYGVYLIDNSQFLIMSIGKQAAPELCMSLFDKPNVQSLPANMMTLPVLDNDYSRRVRNIVKKIRHSSSLYPLLFVIREDDARMRPLMMSYMMEDKSDTAPSYTEFLTLLAKGTA